MKYKVGNFKGGFIDPERGTLITHNTGEKVIESKIDNSNHGNLNAVRKVKYNNRFLSFVLRILGGTEWH